MFRASTSLKILSGYSAVLSAVVVIISIALDNYGASAQQGGLGTFNRFSAPTQGGTTGAGDAANAPNFGPSGNSDLLRHRDFTGKPCLSVGAFARPHTINPNLYDHVIVAVNGCPERITMRVCYYQSDDCISVDVPGNERKESILGTLPSAKDFRFEFREKFQ